jgi:hypothetical protein
LIDDLPELGDIFTTHKEESRSKLTDTKLQEDEISIFISKESDKWISANFIDIAPGGIGLHVIIPTKVEFTPEDFNKISIKFVKNDKNGERVLKKVPVLIRWQERDQVSGKLKLGLHFHGEVKSEDALQNILKTLMGHSPSK